MFKLLCATAIVSASVAATPSFAAHRYEMRAQDDYGQSYSGPNGGFFLRPGEAPNRVCPQGSIPQVFPTGNGFRCELPSGGYTY